MLLVRELKDHYTVISDPDLFVNRPALVPYTVPIAVKSTPIVLFNTPCP